MKTIEISLNCMCPRCGGHGSVNTSMFNGTCFWCQGKGTLSEKDIKHIVRYHSANPEKTGGVQVKVIEQVEVERKGPSWAYDDKPCPYAVDLRLSKANDRVMFRVRDCKKPEWQQATKDFIRTSRFFLSKGLVMLKARETKSDYTFWLVPEEKKEKFGYDFATTMRAGDRHTKLIEAYEAKLENVNK